MQNYFYHYQGQSYGPFNLEEIQALNLPGDTPIWNIKTEKWQQLDNLPEFNANPLDEKLEEPLTTYNWMRYLSIGKSSYSIIAKYKQFKLSFWFVIGFLILLSISIAYTYQNFPNSISIISYRSFLSIIGFLGSSFLLRIALFVASLVCLISYLEIIYFSWRILEFDKVKISPSKAIAYLFIPFYNIWWAYYSTMSLVEELQSFAIQRKISNIPQISQKFTLSLAILSMLVLIPFVSIFVLIPFLIVSYIYISQIAEFTAELYRYAERNSPNNKN